MLFGAHICSSLHKEREREEMFKDQKRKICHHLLTLMSFRTWTHEEKCSVHCFSIRLQWVGTEVTPIYNIHESPYSRSILVELGKVEGFWSMLQLVQQSQAKYLIVEQQAHWLLMWWVAMRIIMWLYQTENLSACAPRVSWQNFVFFTFFISL